MGDLLNDDCSNDSGKDKDAIEKAKGKTTTDNSSTIRALTEGIEAFWTDFSFISIPWKRDQPTVQGTEFKRVNQRHSYNWDSPKRQELIRYEHATEKTLRGLTLYESWWANWNDLTCYSSMMKFLTLIAYYFFIQPIYDHLFIDSTDHLLWRVKGATSSLKKDKNAAQMKERDSSITESTKEWHIASHSTEQRPLYIDSLLHRTRMKNKRMTAIRICPAKMDHPIKQCHLEQTLEILSDPLHSL